MTGTWTKSARWLPNVRVFAEKIKISNFVDKPFNPFYSPQLKPLRPSSSRLCIMDMGVKNRTAIMIINQNQIPCGHGHAVDS
jgi:hypothetical protein